jgi:hypothetical protein
VAPSQIPDLALPESPRVPSMVPVNPRGVGHGSLFFTRVLRVAEEDCAPDPFHSIQALILEPINFDETLQSDAKPLLAQILDGFGDRLNGGLRIASAAL